MGNPTVGEIPNHWECITLGEVCDRGGGNIKTGPFGSQLHAPDYVTVCMPSIMPVNISDNRLIEVDITVKLVFRNDAVSQNIIYRTLLTPEDRSHCGGHATGTTNLGLAREDFLSYALIVPPTTTQEAFYKFMADLEGHIDTNERSRSTLAALRDTLLPKMLSGELRVVDAMKQVDDTMSPPVNEPTGAEA